MPDIKVCNVCGDAHWADRSCPTCTNRAAPAEITRLRAEVERLREALKPIAELARHYDPVEDDDHLTPWGACPTIGDLRRARKALEGGE